MVVRAMGEQMGEQVSAARRQRGHAALPILEARIAKLEELAESLKQTPSDRCLFARVGRLEGRVDQLMAGPQVPRIVIDRPATRPQPSARERFLEQEAVWLRQQITSLQRELDSRRLT